MHARIVNADRATVTATPDGILAVFADSELASRHPIAAPGVSGYLAAYGVVPVILSKSAAVRLARELAAVLDSGY